MRKKIVVALAVVAAALLFVTNPLVARASGLLTGADIKNNSLKGVDIKESSLGAVPKAKSLTPLPSGQTESGAFSAAGANSSGAGGWLGFEINYPRQLTTAIANDHIVDTFVNPDATHCPGPGRASRGYLCLYFYDHSGTGAAYGYSSTGPYAELPESVGVGLYDPVTGAHPYVDGIWTVKAP